VNAAIVYQSTTDVGNPVEIVELWVRSNEIMIRKYNILTSM
jgi:hypothetical protein